MPDMAELRPAGNTYFCGPWTFFVILKTEISVNIYSDYTQKNGKNDMDGRKKFCSAGYSNRFGKMCGPW